jgi:hypothetical protein
MNPLTLVQNLRAPLLFGLLLVLLLALLFWWLRPQPLRFKPKPLLTANEIEFYGRLQTALPDFHIFPQVAFRAILRPGSGGDSPRYAAESGRIGAKHCDFLICERQSFAIIAIIELDDRSHDPDKDARRDAMTAAAGYPTLRYESRRRPSPQEIRQALLPLRRPPPN